METWLCERCGEQLDCSVRVCPSCGALNPHNAEVITESIKQIAKETKSIRKFSNSYSAIALIIGIALFAIHVNILVSGFSHSFGFAFVGTVSALMVVFLAVLGLTKKENVGCAILISCGISLWMRIMAIVF